MSYAPSPEFRLLAACCVWPPSAKRTEEIRNAIAAGIDWTRFLQIVRRHRVAGLAHHGLTGDGTPPATAQALAGSANDITRQNLRLAAEALGIQRAFQSAGIAGLFLKGTALASLAYGNLSVKMASDIDVLVPPGSARTACEVLRKAGYARTAPAGESEDERFDGWIANAGQAAFFQTSRGACVDLHWRIADDWPTAPNFRLWGTVQQVEISPGVALPTLGDEDLFSFLCLHGAHHAWSRLKWLADIHAWLGRKNEDAIGDLYRAAVYRGVDRAAEQAMLLCRTVFGWSLPTSVAREMRNDVISRLLLRIALDAMGCDGRVDETPDRALGGLPILASQFLVTPGLRNGLRIVRGNSFGYQDYEQIALPRRLFFLYPVMRAPMWIWRRSGRLLSRA